MDGPNSWETDIKVFTPASTYHLQKQTYGHWDNGKLIKLKRQVWKNKDNDKNKKYHGLSCIIHHSVIH